MNIHDDRLAHGIAIWACEPAGYAWRDVRGNLRGVEDANAVRERLHENLRDRRTGDALDDAMDRADAALEWEIAATTALANVVRDLDALVHFVDRYASATYTENRDHVANLTDEARVLIKRLRVPS